MTMAKQRKLVENEYKKYVEYDENVVNEFREKLKDTEEGYDSQGRSYFVDVLIGLKPEWEDLLLRYDEAIKEYVEKLRQSRRQPNFNLKYFQYLAVLFTEIFLDEYYNDRKSFLKKLKPFQCCLRVNHTSSTPQSQISIEALSLKGIISPNGLSTLCLRFTNFVTLFVQGSILSSLLRDYLGRTKHFEVSHLLVSADLSWHT